jgi:hypothetical protein
MRKQPTKLLQKVNTATEVKKYFFITFIPSFLYAVVRYNIFQEVSWSQTPLWVSNKAFAMTATLLIGLSFSLPSTRPRKEIGLLGFYIALIHMVMSAILLSPSYYSAFYQTNGQFTLGGELTILAGVLSLSALLLATFFSFPQLSSNEKVNLSFIHKAVLLGLFFNLIHLIVMGASGWFNFSHWPGYLPPITLVGAIACFFYMSKRLLRKSS